MTAALRWGGGVVIAVVAVTRCVIFFAGQLVFDLDPMVDAAPLNGFGPAGSLALDVVVLLACAAALLGESRAGRRLEWPLLLAAALPMPIVFWHGASDAGDLWRGATWMSAAIAAVTVAHLARDVRLRLAITAILFAAVGALLVRGAANVTHEYGDTIRTFEAHRAEIFAGNGWEPESAQARIFERRLRHRQPTGWFVTTNIYASVMAFALVAAVGLAIACARAGMSSGWAGLMALVAAGAGAAVWATGSKGATLTAAAGIVLVVAPFVSARIAGLLRRFGGIVAIGCVGLALAGIVARGTVLPESFAGDRSLLFRWHYMTSSAQIVAEHPVAGVGPAGYQRAYVAHRHARNPEEVASAHSVFWDWVARLGAGGLGWVTLTLVLLARAGRSLARAPDEAPGAPAIGPSAGVQIALAVVVGLGFGLIAEMSGLDAFVGVVRAIGIIAAAGFAVALVHLLARVDDAIVGWSLAAASIVLVVHAQIEMTLTQPGAAVWCLCALGLSGWKPADQGASRRLGVVAALVLVACAAWLTIVGVRPAYRSERLMEDAARTIGAVARQPGTDAERGARQEAARILLEADAAMPTRVAPRVIAAEQLERAAALAPAGEQAALLREALAHAHDAIERGARGRAEVVAISLHRRLAGLTGDASELRQAIDLARSMVGADPNGLGARRRLADLLWEADRRDEAREAYRRALEINDAFGLDALKQLPAGDRAELQRRSR